MSGCYRSERPVGLISRYCHWSGDPAPKPAVSEHILGILRAQYPDFGPTLACEKLRSRRQIELARETVRQMRVSAALWFPRKLRSAKTQRLRW